MNNIQQFHFDMSYLAVKICKLLKNIYFNMNLGRIPTGLDEIWFYQKTLTE